ncbi:MAG: radical SAM protein [Candidatus Pacebacteria bacterium]|nr:radical SAM protein [Candidatus Paceibacterota bacterium]
MNIALVYPDFVISRRSPGSNKFNVVKGGWYSEGLASLSSVLKEKGHRVSLIHLTEPIKKEDFKSRLKDINPEIVGFTARTSAFLYICDYLKWTKEANPSSITILGGCHPSISPDESITAEGADFVCVGEGEGAFVDLADSLNTGQSFDNISNLLIKKNNQVIKNPPRNLIFPLDSLPFPDFELFDYMRLISTQIKVATTMISRGCPYDCAYCCNHKIKEVYPDPEHYTRFRSPINAVLYLKKLLSINPWISSFRFLDNIFGIKEKWLEEFSYTYKKEINLPFSCDHRPNLANLKILDLLKEAGCYQIYFGVETGNEELRKNILSRNMTNIQIEEAFNNCRKLGIKTLAYNIVGLPKETPAKTLETIKLNAEIKPDSMVVNIFTPYPFTKLYEICLNNHFIADKIDYKEDVFINQPDFSKKEVLFLSLYFKLFTRLYSLNERLWPLMDRIILWKYLPKNTLIFLMKRWDSFNNWLKDSLRKRMPSIYIFTRKRIRRIKS